MVIRMDKKELRSYIRMQKQQFTDEALVELSLPIMKRLMAHPKVKHAQTVLFYYSLKDEVHTHTTIQQLADEGKKVLLPAIIDGENIELRYYESPKDVERGFFNIMEPVGKAIQEEEYGKIDVAIIPGMGFDSRNNRLGRGKGYYDRLLVKMQEVYKIGVCFDFQKMPGIPADAHDIKMDEII